MDKIVEGYWDCSYCGNKKISGLKRNCPSCGRPRGDDVKFYLAGERQEVEKPVSEGPDWLCPYCGGLNPSNADHCLSCGAERSDSKDDYFSMHQKKEEQEAAEHPAPTPQPRKSGLGKLLLIMGGIIAALILISVISGVVRSNRVFTITDKYWNRSIEILEEQDVRYSEWYLPADAENVTSSDEIYGYDQVLDHYETREVQRSRQVLDGYDLQEGTPIDNGNGTFTIPQIQVPRYRTEYYTETVQDPVYVRIPIYKTKYYFTRREWVQTRVERFSGVEGEDPNRELLRINEFERAGEDLTTFIVRTDRGNYITYESIWDDIEIGGKYKFNINGDTITAYQKQ